MNARSLSCLFGLLISTLIAPAQGTLLDCSCLSTQAVLLTNACQAVLPDLCLATNCIGNSAVAPADLSCSQAPAPGTPVGPGVHPITVTIIDLNGTPLSCTVLFQVVPLPACRFTLLCASNQTVECGAPWSFTPPVWTNACAPPLGTPSNGVVLTVVSTVTNGVCPTVITRTWQAVDDCQQVATCSQKITVVDTTPPVLDCACLTNSAAFPPLPLVLTHCTATIPDLCPRALACASDNCGPPACTQSPPAGTPVGPGSHSITVTVTDCAGNTAACSVTLVVVAPTGIRVWNTGMTGLLGNIPVPSGTPELNYTLVSGPAPCAGPAIVLNGPPAGNLVNTAVSKWIAPIPAGAPFCPSGLYHYRLRFVLGCTNGASLTGRLASDDQAQVYLNNQWIAVSSSYTTWTNFSVSSGFVPGTNTIDILLTNVPCCTGLRVEMTNQFTCCCPQAVVLQCPSQPVRAWVCPGSGPVRVPYTVTATSLCAPAGGTPTVTCLPPSPGPFPPGVTTVTCTATDALGNVNSCSFPVTVAADTVPPVISCPAPITVSTCDPAVTVRYKARASDDCSAATVACVPPSGSSFPAGTVTSVTCTAVDACGNSATCSFPVRVMNNLIWQLFARGADDCYAAAYEPTAPGPVLAATYPGLPWKAFDDPTPNRGVGVLWSGLPTNAIDGWVNTRVRPVLCRSFSGTQNDIIALGLANVGGPWQWLRYFGQGNGPAGLLAADWCDQTNGCTTPLWISLLTPPVTSGPPPALLSNLNALARLDMFVQDDTRVDFAHLWLRRCAPPGILGGFPTVLNNARIVNGPRGVWCLIRDLPTVNPWTARMELGAVPAVALPLRHRARSAEVRLALGAAFRPEATRSLPGIGIVHAGDEAPLAELRLATVPAGVTEVEVTRLDQGVELDTQRVPAGEGAVLAAFSPDTELLGATLGARGALLEFAFPNNEPGTQIRLRYLPEPAAEPIGELIVETLGVDALDVGDPQVRGEADALLVTVGGDALARAEGGQVSLSALDPVDGAPLALAVRRAGPARVTVSLQQELVLTRVAEPPVASYLPTQEVAVAVQAVLQEAPGAVPLTSRELTFSPVGVQADGSLARVRPEMTFRWRRDAGRYEVQAGDLDGDGQADVLASVEIWSHATLVALVPNPGRVEVEALPALYRVSLSSWRVDADLCHRFPWNRAERVWVNDVAYDATELRVNQQPFGAAAERPAGWAGVDVWAAGFDALVLDRAIVGAPQGRFHPPLRFQDPATGQASDLWLGWDLPGLRLESAPSVHGPWLPLPTEGTEAEVSPTPSRQFFRLRE